MENAENIVKLKEMAQDYSILFVEDSKALQKQIMKFLSKLFKNVYVASDGLEGYEAYRQYRPDLVLTDLTMPRMDGHELIREIKMEDPDIDIIILSAHSDPETLMKSLHIGVTDFIAKPVNAQKMIAVFLKVVSNIKRKEIKYSTASNTNNTQNESKENTANEVRDEDNDILDFLFENSMNIDVINHYRGVPIINSGTILDIDNDEIRLKTTNLQLLAILNEKGTILDSSLISEDIECELLSSNLDDYEVVLKKKRLFYPETKDRNELIVEPDVKVKTFLSNDEHDRVEVSLDGISTKELFINLNSKSSKFKKHDKLDILVVFSCNDKGEHLEYLNIETRVYRIEEEAGSTKLVLLIKGSPEIQITLQGYLFKREMELIEEFKTKYQYS